MNSEISLFVSSVLFPQTHHQTQVIMWPHVYYFTFYTYVYHYITITFTFLTFYYPYSVKTAAQTAD